MLITDFKLNNKLFLILEAIKPEVKEFLRFSIFLNGNIYSYKLYG